MQSCYILLYLLVLIIMLCSCKQVTTKISGHLIFAWVHNILDWPGPSVGGPWGVINHVVALLLAPVLLFDFRLEARWVQRREQFCCCCWQPSAPMRRHRRLKTALMWPKDCWQKICMRWTCFCHVLYAFIMFDSERHLCCFCFIRV